jgi:hypothetical protein
MTTTDALYQAEWQHVALHQLAANEGWREIAEAGAAHLREAGYAAIADGAYIVVGGTRYRTGRIGTAAGSPDDPRAYRCHLTGPDEGAP